MFLVINALIKQKIFKKNLLFIYIVIFFIIFYYKTIYL